MKIYTQLSVGNIIQNISFINILWNKLLGYSKIKVDMSKLILLVGNNLITNFNCKETITMSIFYFCIFSFWNTFSKDLLARFSTQYTVNTCKPVHSKILHQKTNCISATILLLLNWVSRKKNECSFKWKKYFVIIW